MKPTSNLERTKSVLDNVAILLTVTNGTEPIICLLGDIATSLSMIADELHSLNTSKEDTQNAENE